MSAVRLVPVSLSPTCLSLTILTALAACAPVKKPVPATPPPPVVETVMPLPPMGAAQDMDVPAIGTDGQRITPNRQLSAYSSLWHLRMALNVAALSCRDPGDAPRLQYNQILRIHKTDLALANAAVDNEYRQRFGSNAVVARERLNTTVYNFFALPPAQPAFCTAATLVGAKVALLPPAALLAYAPEGLAAVEKPFTDFYEAYADYLRRLAEWRARYARGTVTVLPAVDDAPPPPLRPAPPPGVVPTQPRLEVQPLPSTMADPAS